VPSPADSILRTLWPLRRQGAVSILLVLVTAAGCETPNGTHAAPGASPASAKWEGPLMPGPGGGQVRTTIYYGPWQCTQRWMAHCQTKCASEGRKLMGCMWLADIKTDWQGRYLGPPLAAGGRYAITHCCCDYPLVKDTALRRQQWKSARDSFRKEWGEEFGEWPKSGDEHWPGHHIRDLQRGGDATARRNVLPAPSGVHGVFTDEYPMCYAGGSRWSTVGPDRPYTD
jgi:hypothetical protein